MKLFVRQSVDIKRVITDCYKTDDELIEKYHKLSPTTLAEAVVYTVSSLIEIKNELVFYEIYHEKEFAGYFAIQNNKILVGFFILPQFRKKEFIFKFWRIIKSKFDKEIFCGLYQHNIRAINFIKKNGFILYNEIEPNIKFFKYN